MTSSLPGAVRHAPGRLADATWAEASVSQGVGLTVGHVVPPEFEAFGRLLRPVHHDWRSPEGPGRWSDVAAASGRRLDPTTRWEELRPAEGTEPSDGDLDGPEAVALADVLSRFTGSPECCLGLVWTGRPGGDQFGSDLFYGGNQHVVLEGSVRAVAALHADGVTATAWWPLDRSWFVHTDIDGYDTYLGCSTEALGALAADPRLEVLPIDVDDDVDTSPFPPYGQS